METLVSPTAIGQHIADNLIGGSKQLVTGTITLASGQNLVRGTIVGRITASGKFKAYDAAATDGSQNPVGILTNPVDATTADTNTTIYLEGQFAKSGITGLGATAAAEKSTRIALEARNIFVTDPQ
jgi:hypothetical protein